MEFHRLVEDLDKGEIFSYRIKALDNGNFNFYITNSWNACIFSAKIDMRGLEAIRSILNLMKDNYEKSGS